jgi:RpiB/LacA/LacB family sugar-phosphate isomerase
MKIGIASDHAGYALKQEIIEEFGNVVIDFGCNRFLGVRAALCLTTEMAVMTRKHNNANVLCLGSRLIKKETAFEIIKCFINTKFEGGRHLRRINKLFFNTFEEVVDSPIS